jgi:hypothetical protein
LKTLAKRFPEQVLDNPVLEIFAMEDLTGFVLFRYLVWSFLLRRDQVETVWLEAAAAVYDLPLWYLVLEHSNTPLKVLETMDRRLGLEPQNDSQRDRNDLRCHEVGLRSGILSHPNASMALIDAHLHRNTVVGLFRHPNAPAWVANLRNLTPGVNERQLARIVAFRDAQSSLLVASYPDASAEVLDDLLLSDSNVREQVAKHPNTSIQTLERLAHGSDWCAIARRWSPHDDGSVTTPVRQLASALSTGDWRDLMHRDFKHQRLKFEQHKRRNDTKDEPKKPSVRGGVYLLKWMGNQLVKVIQTEPGRAWACHWYWHVDPVICEEPAGAAALRAWVHERDAQRTLSGRIESWSLEDFDAFDPMLLDRVPVHEHELESLRKTLEFDLWNQPGMRNGAVDR